MDVDTSNNLPGMGMPAAAPAAGAGSDANYPEPPPDAVVLQEGEWHDFDTRELLRRVAMANCANRTGELDWNEGATPMGHGLVAISQGFCDNFLLRCLVSKYQIKVKDGKDGRSQEYVLFGRRCAKMREILAEHGIAIRPEDVSGARLYDTGKVKQGESPARLPQTQQINSTTVPELDTSKGPAPWYWQLIKVAVPNADLQAVVDLIRSGEFARWGLWFNDLDVT